MRVQVVAMLSVTTRMIQRLQELSAE
jgi:hypothetical protein